MKRVLSFLVVMGSLSVLGACSGSKSSSVDNVGPLGGVCDNSGVDSQQYLSGIVSGKKLGSRNPVSSRVVSLYFSENNSDGEICTGSLLPGHVVLTAGHCVASSPSKMTVFFNNNLNCVAGTGNSTFGRQVTAIELNPRYHGSTSENDDDIAMVHFAGDLPPGYTTFDYPRGTTSFSPNEKLIMSGYGVTGYKSKDPGVLRITSTTANHIESDSFSAKSIVVRQHETGVCSGDSGSPLMVYRGGQLQIVGVTSTVSNDRGVDESQLCSGDATFVDVSKHQSWIRTAYDKLRDDK